MSELVFGQISEVKVGQVFDSRADLAEAGVHRPTMAGIWGREKEGACSIVLSGGYEDDIDKLDYIYYTGHGGKMLLVENRYLTKSLLGETRVFN